MILSDRIIEIVSEWMGSETKPSSRLGEVVNSLPIFDLKSHSMAACLWELLRDNPIPSSSKDQQLRESIVECIYSSKLVEAERKELNLRGRGPEWKHSHYDSALISPEINKEEIDRGIKKILLGPNLSSIADENRNNNRELLRPKNPLPPLRDYQSEVIGYIMEKLLKSDKKCILVLPPGTGKTRCAVEVIVRLISSGTIDEVIWSTNRLNLLSQTENTLRTRWINSPSEEEDGTNRPPFWMINNQGEPPTDGEYPMILFRTLQGKPHEGIEPNPKRLLIIDEAHSHLDQSSKLVTEIASSGGLVLGMSATIDEKYLEIINLFGSIIIPKSVKFKRGHILDTNAFVESKILAEMVEHQPESHLTSLSEIDMEYHLEHMVEIITHYVEELNLKKSLVYVNRVDTAKLLAGLLCGKGIPSTHVSGATKEIVQDSIQQDIEDGNIRLVTNAKLWVEGKDIPSIDSVFVLRNTDHASRNSIQMIGRAQRGPASEDGTDKAHIIWGY